MGLFAPPLPLLAGLSGVVDTDGIGAKDVIAALVVGFATIIAAIVAGWATRKWLSRPGSPSAEVAALAARLARWVIIIVGTAWALSFVGVSIGWLGITVVAVLAVVFLIIRPQLEGLAAAVVVTTRPAFGVGDEVQVDKWRGEVVEVTSRSVVLRTRDGHRVHLPNSAILQEIIVVISTDHAERSEVAFDVDQATDMEQLERVALDAVEGLPGVLGDPSPALRAQGLGGGAISVVVRYWHDAGLGAATASTDQVVRALGRALTEAGIRTSTDSVDVTLAGGPPGQAIEPSVHSPR